MNNQALSFTERSNQWTAYALSLLRIVAGLLIMQHGMQKLFGMLDGHVMPLASQVGFGGILEFGGGLLLLLGLFTRPVAFILSGMMAVAYFQMHMFPNLSKPDGFWPIINKGEMAVLYCFIFLFLSAAGSGPWSLDAVIGRRRNG